MPTARILLVDDNPSNLLALRALLGELGHELVEVHSGEEALAQVEIQEFAAVLLDVRMPGMNGFETALAIRSRKDAPHTPIIFLTAEDPGRQQLEEAYALGAVDFLVKPLIPVILQAKVRGFVALFQDKERARREADQLRLLVQGTNEYAIFMLDPEGNIATWNSGAERLNGYEAQEIIGQHFSRFYPQEAIDRGWPTHELKVARAEGRFEDEGWRLRKDGSRFRANVVITALHDERGVLRGFSKVTRDMTERKRAEDNARRLIEEEAARRIAEEKARVTREQREQLHVTLASIGDAVITTDADGRVTFVNRVAEDLIGWNQEEAASQQLEKVFRIVNQDTRSPVENPALRSLKEGVIVGLANHTILISKQGAERPIDDSAAPIKNAAGDVIGSVLVFRDVSEQKRAEKHRIARLAVTHALNQADTLADGLNGVLEAICQSLGWDVGFYWSADSEGCALACRHSWRRHDSPSEGFAAASCNRTFQPGEGLPGRVWTSGEAAWVLDLANDPDFPRLSAAVSHGLQSALACPILHGEEVIGVIEFFAHRIRQPDADLLEMIGTIAGSVAQFIHRKAAEEELRTSEQELADFFENATVGLHWVGPDGTIIRANQAELTMLGYTREEYVGRNIRDFHADEDVICDILNRLGAGEKLDEYPASLRCKDGSIREVLIDSSVLWKNGKFVHTRCFTRDVTERRRAERARRESEEKLRQLADAMPQIVWTATPEGNIDYLNQRWHEFTGLPNSVGNQGWSQILHPNDAQAASERWQASLSTGTPFEMELRLLDSRPQAYRWHLIRTVAAHDERGNVTRWYGTSTDIHEQKLAEESSRYLADASAALASVVDYESTLQKVATLAVPHFADWSAVDVRDPNGSVRRLAVAHQDDDKIALVRQLMQEYPPDPEATTGAAGVLRSGKPEIISEINDELLAQAAKDDRHLHLLRSLGLKSYICVPLIVSGSPLGVLTFATAESGRKYTERDVALAMDLARRASVAVENTQLYQALRETDRRKDEFLATLAHELRNPLAPIRNAIEILKLPRVDDETIARSLELMERQIHHLVRLVDDLMDVSRVMRGKIELRNEQVELASVVARAVESVQPLADAQGHQLSIRLPGESLLIDADPIRLAQVVGNLLTNAIKYTKSNGRISVSGAREGADAVLTIRDNGIGIDPHMLPRVFDLFMQADNTATRSQGGLGIGLTLVRNLVEMHNGSVEARSGGLGKGSEFVVRLPLSKVQGDRILPASKPKARAIQSSGRRLLVVDDNQDAATTLAMLLELQGHEVKVANSGRIALEIAKEFIPDAVFMDIGMPEMDGYELARRIRQQPGFEKVVLAALTGWGQQEDRRRTAEAGFDHHFVKPPEPIAIQNLISSLPK